MNNQVQVQKPSNVATVKDLLVKNQEAMMQSLPSHIRVDRLMRIVLTQLTKNPKLQECTQGSLIGSILQGALLGLEPDGVEGALIPFKIQGVMTCTFQPMYQGLIKLAHFSPKLQVIYADVVKENDRFELEKGLHQKLIHTPALSNRGKLLGAYACYHTTNGGCDFEYMCLEELVKVMNTSRAKNKTDSPWKHWPDEMHKKTVLKRLSKRVPKSRELHDAVQIDNNVHSGKLSLGGTFKQAGVDAPADFVPEIAAPESTETKPEESSGEDLNDPES